ncbi:DNA helicase [Tanacetum coccineum]
MNHVASALRKVIDGNDEGHCVDHGPQPNPTYRYNFKSSIMDNLATVGLTFFTPNADVLTGADCTQLVKKHGTSNPRMVTPTTPIQPAGISESAQMITGSTTTATPESTDKQDFQKQEPPSETTKTAATPESTDKQGFDKQEAANETTNKAVKRSLFPEDTAKQSRQLLAEGEEREEALPTVEGQAKALAEG